MARSCTFCLHVQDPKDARLVFTVMDDDVVGAGSPIGSTSRKLKQIFPASSQEDLIKKIKDEVLEQIERGEKVDLNQAELLKSVIQEWEGDLKLTSKPRIKDKKGQITMAAAAGAAVAGPVGAAVGGLFGNFYEGEVRQFALI